ncbi:MAG: hypothetical protein ACFCVB_18205 [Nodosilinea sp.]
MVSTSALLTFEDYLAQTDGLEGCYENTVFTGAQPVISQVFPGVDLTAQQMLNLQQQQS